MKDLLKEAIADAKAVRETALANAKLALEEAFTPRLTSMLSAKLAEEMSEDEDAPAEDEMTHEGEEMDMEDDQEMAEGEEEMSNEDDDLDLDEIIRELEMEGSEDDAAIDNEDNEDDEDVDINEIIRSLREEDDEDVEDDEDDDEDEDVDINEIIRSLREEEDEDVEDVEDTKESSEDLEEAYNVIRFLKDKINEVNLLNAKLLYSNKLFRNFSLNEGQKMKVIENFDRSHNLREVKLVYSTLAEGFKMPSTKKVVKESFASKPIASTKPAKQVISEGAELANRFKKLAGLK